MERTAGNTPQTLDSARSATARQTWRPLDLLNLYRLTLAGLLVVLALSETDATPLLGGTNPALFLGTAITYLAFALISGLAIRWRRPPFSVQLYAQIVADIIAVILVTYASGGVRSGLGMLLIITVAGGGIMVRAEIAAMFASIASLAVLGEEAYTHLRGGPGSFDYTHAGILGATFFATALLANTLARRARESEALAAQRGVDLANMEQLTEYVIQRMQTGVVVVDPQERIRLINESAWQLLGHPVIANLPPLAMLSPELADQLRAWKAQPLLDSRLFRPAAEAPEILPRFARLGTHTESGTLIFLEDMAATAQQAQQMKLASLGRLTASIAHEIRNPLGAISHAGQLLAESPRLDKADTRLTEIIRDQSQRMNVIVENVLQLSRRSRSHPEEFELKPWLEQFISEFTRALNIDPQHVTLRITPADARVRVDRSQLHQILWNLCDNGARYSRAQTGAPRLELSGGREADSPSPTLEIIDWGKGIADESVQHVFEPFFTTETKGTGLGLYLARELCECNQARLAYRRAPHGGSIFRITFADPRRKQVA